MPNWDEIYSVYICNRVKRSEHKQDVHIDGKNIPKAKSTHCNRMLQYSIKDMVVFAKKCERNMN
jgi:hypothetical protein